VRLAKFGRYLSDAGLMNQAGSSGAFGLRPKMVRGVRRYFMDPDGADDAVARQFEYPHES